jgi:hypothetical protein
MFISLLKINQHEIYNKGGNPYGMDSETKSIYSYIDGKWVNANDERLWPIYHRDRKYNMNQRCIIWADQYRHVGTIPYYFQLKDGRVRLLQVKNAVISKEIDNNHYMDTRFMHEIYSKDLNYRKIKNGMFYPLVIDGIQLYILDSLNHYDVGAKIPMILRYSFHANGYLLSKSEEGSNVPIYIELNKIYPFIVLNSNGEYEHKKMEIGRTDKDWWMPFGANLLNVHKLFNGFSKDVLYFQIDDNGILQIFHSLPTNSQPVRTSFTGQAYDLKFNPPMKLTYA